MRVTKSKEEIKQMSQHELNRYFINKAQFASVKEIRYLLTSPELKYNAYIHYTDNHAIISACWSGNTEVVKYLLSSPELKEHADVFIGDGYETHKGLIQALRHNRVEVVQYLMEEIYQPLSKDREEAIQKGLDLACKNQSMDVLTYIVENYKKIHIKTEQAFQAAITQELKEKFVFMHNLPLTKKMKELIKDNELMQSLFNKKEFNRKLNKSLHNSNNPPVKKNKI